MKRNRTPIAVTLATAALISGCQGMPSEAEMEEQVQIVHANVDELAAFFGEHPEVVQDYVGLCDIEISDEGEEVLYDLRIPMDRITFLTIAEQLPAHYEEKGWTPSPDLGDDFNYYFYNGDEYVSVTFRPRRDEVDITGGSGCRH